MAESVILTGASGYIGRNLVCHLQQHRIDFATLDDVRSSGQASASPESGERSEPPVLIHLAGVSGRESVDAASRKRARQTSRQAIDVAREQGGRFAILASSIYASLAEQGRGGEYGEHKLEIERLFSSSFGQGLVILRLPPIYGGEADHSSVTKLGGLVRSRLPLPLGRATAQRDYLAMANLLDLVLTVAMKVDSLPALSGPRIYSPSDGTPISTVELVHQLAEILNVPARLLSFPEPAVRWLLKALGRGGLGEGAFSALRAEGNVRLLEDFDWRPSTTMPQSLTYLQRQTAI